MRTLFRFALLGVFAGAVPACALGGTHLETTANAVDTGTLRGRVRVRVGRYEKTDHGDVVVYLQGVPGELPDTSNVVHEVRQINKTFIPEVSVVLRGTTVSFPNDDRVFHNVFSVSKAARFDLGLYKSGTTKTVTLKRAGEIEVFCNIHEDMAAKILVLDTTYFAVTDKKGDFVVRGIPPGTYRWVAWHAWGEAKTGKVRIEASGTAELDLELEEADPPRHLRKNGAAYGRYE